MQKVMILAVVSGLATVFAVGTAAAEQLPHLKQQCPAAAAWLSSPHDGLSVHERKKLESIKPSDPALAKQLAQRYARDQAAEETAARAHAFSKPKEEATKLRVMKHLLTVQKTNLEWFEAIVAAHGFPTIQQVGFKGMEHAWILVQHAGEDPKFQTKVLDELQPQLASDAFLRNDYALLTDRLRVGAHKPQIYGTQFTMKHGRLVMQATENVQQLDERRGSMGLMPISDYRCFLKVLYHVAPQPAAPSQSVEPRKRS